MPTELYGRIRERFADQVLDFDESTLNPSIKLAPAVVAEVGRYLKADADLQFNYLMCLSGVDYGVGKPLGVVYHLQSMILAFPRARHISLLCPCADGSLQ